MLNSFLTIGEQIFIVFLLMAVGYIGGKTGLITNALAAVDAGVERVIITKAENIGTSTGTVITR